MMKTQKLSLKNIANALSRAELKKIMAGSSGGGGSLNCCSCIGFTQGEVYWGISDPYTCQAACTANGFHGGQLVQCPN